MQIRIPILGLIALIVGIVIAWSFRMEACIHQEPFIPTIISSGRQYSRTANNYLTQLKKTVKGTYPKFSRMIGI